MYQILKGKTAIVTGSGRGIGRAIAMGYAHEGANVVLTSRTISELEPVRTSIISSGGRAISIRADIKSEAEIENLVGSSLNEFGGIDILVNNAGAPGNTSSLQDITEAEWKEVFDTNVFGIFICTKTVVASMLNVHRGNIINISSGAGIKKHRKYIRSLPYTVSKFAVEGFNHALSVRLQGTGINVNAIQPGFVRTGFQKGWSAEEMQKHISMIGQIAEPETIVPSAIFLAALEPGQLTGESITTSQGDSVYQEMLKRMKV